MTPSKCILLALALFLSIDTTWASVCSTTDLLKIDINCLTPAADDCLANDDTQIQCLTCNTGYFLTGAGTCNACSVCHTVDYQVTACSATANTVCEECNGRTTNCSVGGALAAGTCVLGESAIQCDTAKCLTNYILAAAGPETGTCNQCAESDYYSASANNGVGGCTPCTLATAGCTTALTSGQWCIGDKVACDAKSGNAPEYGCSSGYAIQYDGTCQECTMKPPGCKTLQANGCNTDTIDLNKSTPTDTTYYAYGICTSCVDGYEFDAIHGVCTLCDAGKSLAKDGTAIGTCVECTDTPPNCDTALPTWATPVLTGPVEWYGCTSSSFSASSPTYKRCVVCNDGYFVTASGLCQVCTSPEDDDVCAAITCTADSYFDTTTGSCQTCTLCTGGSGLQTECQSGGDVFTNSVCTVCTGKPDDCETAEANSCVLNTTTRKCAKCAVPYALQANSANAGLCWACLDGEALNSSGFCQSCTETPTNCALTTPTYPGTGAACISSIFPTTKICLECDAGYYLKDGSCVKCSSCSAGQYVSSECSATANTVCKACKSSCSSGNYMSGTCSGSASVDTIQCKECRNDNCEAGYYISKYCTGKTTRDQFGCTKCSTSCPTGQYMEEKCSGSTYADANKCKPIVCKTGFFLQKNSCVKCSSCSAGQYVSSECSATTNTVCKACKSSCSSGNYMSGTCSGSASVDTIQCKACRDDSCEAGYYISKYCTGKTTRDQFGCTKCSTSCPTGQYLEGKCSGSTYADNTKCKACRAQNLCASKQSFKVCVTGETVLKCNKCKKTAKLNTATGICEPYPEYIVVEKPVPVPVPVPRAKKGGRGAVCKKNGNCLSKVCTQGRCAPSDYGRTCRRKRDCQTTLRCINRMCLN